MDPYGGLGTTKRVLALELLAHFRASRCPGCRQVFSPSALTKHHIRPRSLGGPTVIENLVLICRPCHTAIHRHPKGMTALRLRAFLRASRRSGRFPPRPDPPTAEEGIRLFLHWMSERSSRTLNHRIFEANPPFDPWWPVGRHFAPVAEDGTLRFPSAADAWARGAFGAGG